MSFHKVQPVLNSRTPKLDLHGEIVSMVYPLLNEFILDNVSMGNELIRIIHGKSTNILTNEVHEVLKKHKNVIEYNLNAWNIGETIVILRKNG